jgi:predicted CXXCH cytochrome family protein
MPTTHFRSASSKSLSRHLYAMVLIVSLVGIIVPARATFPAGFPLRGNTRMCEFSLQVQKSPYREDFIARMATAVANYWASNDDPAAVSDTSDDSRLSLFSFGRNNAEDRQEGEIDSFSKDCLGCHDGLRASDVTVDYRSRPDTSRRGKHVSGKDHPIGMNYASYAAFGRRYKPVAMLDKKMVLVNGRVGCLTCHNPLNPERGHLVMSDFRSALCLTCHDK